MKKISKREGDLVDAENRATAAEWAAEQLREELRSARDQVLRLEADVIWLEGQLETERTAKTAQRVVEPSHAPEYRSTFKRLIAWIAA